MNGTVKPPPVSPSPYAPTTDPVRLATMTMQAVDRIGTAAADQIEHTAAELERGGKEIADKLRDLAGAIRGHSKVASEHVTEFCEKSMAVLDTIGALHAKLGGEGDSAAAAGAAAKVDAAAQELRIPKFLLEQRNGQSGGGGGQQ